MDALRKLFESLDYTNVETIIASGNVLFDSSSKSSKSIEKKIEDHLEKKLGYTVETFVRSPAEMAAIAKHAPFKPADVEGNVFYVGFLDDAPTASAKKKVLGLATDIDTFHFHERELYWLCRKKFSESKITGNLLERTLEMPTTIRNVNTVRKIAAKMAVVLAVLAMPFHANAESRKFETLTTPEGVVHNLYRHVSVDVGQETDWESVRKLFLPEAVIVLRVSKESTQVFDVQGWIDDFVAWDAKARVKERGFYEKIVAMKPRVFRDIANVFVLYEAAILDSDKPPTRGIDSIELVKKDGRWWIAAITNDIVSAEHPAPPELHE